MYPYHNKIKQRINNRELISYEYVDKYRNISPCLLLHFNTEPWIRPIRKCRFKEYEKIINLTNPMIPQNQQETIKERKEFDAYLQNSKNDFISFINSLDWNVAIRTEADTFIIAFDQVRDRYAQSSSKGGYGFPTDAEIETASCEYGSRKGVRSEFYDSSNDCESAFEEGAKWFRDNIKPASFYGELLEWVEEEIREWSKFKDAAGRVLQLTSVKNKILSLSPKEQRKGGFSLQEVKVIIENFHRMNMAYITGREDDNLDIEEYILTLTPPTSKGEEKREVIICPICGAEEGKQKHSEIYNYSNKPMTIEECKDAVARKRGLNDWKHALASILTYSELDGYFNEAMTLYANQTETNNK